MRKYAAFAFTFGSAFGAIARTPLAIYTDNFVSQIVKLGEIMGIAADISRIIKQPRSWSGGGWA
jgi:hypothetical protein